MDKDEILYLIALLKVENIGPILAKNLIQAFGNVREVFHAKRSDFLRVPKIGEKTAKDLSNLPKYIHDAEKTLQQCEKYGIQVISYQSEEYPSILLEIYDSPLVLYCKGFVNKHLWGVGIVGTRSATEYGKNQTYQLVETLVQNEITVISGLAAGIDSYAHKKCVELKAKNIAVIACGLDSIYPRHHENLAYEIILHGGALISEYPPGAKVKPMNFPLRNRIISGLSKAIVVVESGEKGGALITAHYAFEQNREVWAIPGKITDKKSMGCNLLIKKNIAQIFTHPSDVLQSLRLPFEKKTQLIPQTLFIELSPEEETVFSCIPTDGIDLDSLIVKTELETTLLLSTLLSLEIKGLIEQLPGKKIIKK